MAGTLWESTATDLRKRIMGGEWSDGDMLPTEPELSREYGVSRDTVRQALQHLTAEGILTSQRGRGREVRRYKRLEWWPARFEHLSQRLDHEGSEHDAWQADVARQYRDPRQEVEVGLIAADDLVADRLGVEIGETVARRARTRYVDGRPWQTGDSYYPMWLAEKGDRILLTPGDVIVPGGFMAYLGHQQCWYDDRLTVRMPTLDEIKRLDLVTGTPVLEHVRTAYDADDVAVRVIITIAPGDRHVVRYQVDAR